VVPSLASAGATGGSPDIQGDFQALKDSLSRIKLPPDLKLNESRQGIQRQDQPLFNVLCKCSRYNETLVKLLSTIEPGSIVTQETLDQLFLIAQAQGRYLQDEYAALIVNGQFNNKTSKLFRALQKNTSGLNPSSLDTLRSAASLAAVSKPPQASRYGSYPARCKGSGNYGYYGNNPHQDVFHSVSQKPFPKRQPREPSHND